MAHKSGRPPSAWIGTNPVSKIVKGLVFNAQPCIISGTMYRAEVEPMPANPARARTRTGLWKVVIYEGDRFVRTDRDNIIISVAEKLADKLNYDFGNKKKAKGA